MAKEFGWTLEYIDTLTLADIQEYRDYEKVLEGIQKGQAYLFKKNQVHQPKPVKHR